MDALRFHFFTDMSLERIVEAMSLVAAKCPRCGAIIKVESVDEADTCSVCKAPFIVDRAIKLFDTVGNTGRPANPFSAAAGLSFGAMEEFAVRNGILEKYCGNSPNVVIPNTITYIGDRSFALCDFMLSITIPNSVTYIGNYAFECCTGLTSIVLPDSITAIADSAFKGCTGLRSITLPRNLKSISPHVFEFCEGLTSIIIPPTVKKIHNYAFERCIGLKSVAIPEGVTAIGDSAFENCVNLANVYIPDTLAFLGMSAFEGCTSLANVRLPESFVFSMYIFAKNPWGRMQRGNKLQLQFEWIEKGLCQYCGGEIGLMNKCKVCGKKQP